MAGYWLADLFDEVDGWLEVKAEVDEGPVDALLLVLLLLQDEHCVVKQLLQLLVRVVDAQLLKRVHLKTKQNYTGQSLYKNKANFAGQFLVLQLLNEVIQK